MKGPGASIVREMWRAADGLRSAGGSVAAIWLDAADFDLVVDAYQVQPEEVGGHRWLRFGGWKGRVPVTVYCGQPEEWL